MTNHQKFLLVQDDDCHWYIIPDDCKTEFDAWIERMCSDEEDVDCSQPDWCKGIDGPQSILIHAFSHV